MIEGSRFATFGAMPDYSPEQVRQSLEVLYRSNSGRILATLVGLLGDLDLAQDAMQEAFSAALNVWQKSGIPENPRPWLISTARFKAIDAMRRRSCSDAAQQDLVLHIEAQQFANSQGEEDIEDDRLRLIFICCHPSLLPEAQVALTLRELCGLTTEEIAHAFLIAPRTPGHGTLLVAEFLSEVSYAPTPPFRAARAHQVFFHDGAGIPDVMHPGRYASPHKLKTYRERAIKPVGEG